MALISKLIRSGTKAHSPYFAATSDQSQMEKDQHFHAETTFPKQGQDRKAVLTTSHAFAIGPAGSHEQP
jgi:hypothetical protein